MSSIVQIDKVRPVKSAGQKRQGRLALLIVAVIVVLAVGAYFLFMPGKETFVLQEYDSVKVERSDFTLTAQASGTVDIPNQMILLSPQQGYAAGLFAVIGDTVQKGQILAEITVPDLEEDIEDAESDLINAGVSYQRQLLQNASTLQSKARGIAKLEADLISLADEVERYRKLVEINASRRAELDSKIDGYEAAEESLREARIDFEETEALQALDVELNRISIQRLETRLERLGRQLAESTIRSPITGEVLEIADAVAVPGSLLSLNKELFTVADPSSAVFRLELDETYAASIALGERVAVSVGGTVVYGTVKTIGKVAQASSDGIGSTISVTVAPDDESGSLLLGATAIGTFVLGTEAESMVIPRGPYLTSGSQRYLYVIEGDRAVKTPVSFGKIEGNSVQIVSGVEAGDQVITSSYQSFINFDEIRLQGE